MCFRSMSAHGKARSVNPGGTGGRGRPRTDKLVDLDDNAHALWDIKGHVEYYLLAQMCLFTLRDFQLLSRFFLSRPYPQFN